jgi:signal transduction histidine kinase
VDDDGKGFDVENTIEKGGMGLKVIRDRVEMLGGSMDVDSIVGNGTRVTFQLPTLELQPA